jgi:hypothetical protein
VPKYIDKFLISLAISEKRLKDIDDDLDNQEPLVTDDYTRHLNNIDENNREKAIETKLYKKLHSKYGDIIENDGLYEYVEELTK